MNVTRFIAIAISASALQSPVLNAQGTPTVAGSSYTYCQSNNGSSGQAARISASGSFDVTSLVNMFELKVENVTPAPGSFGMFTYGRTQANIPFGNGTLCISPFTPGLYRMTPQSLGQGTVLLSMQGNQSEFSLIQPGSSWNFQFWYRDPSAGGSNFNLSDAIHVEFAPSL